MDVANIKKLAMALAPISLSLLPQHLHQVIKHHRVKCCNMDLKRDEVQQKKLSTKINYTKKQYISCLQDETWVKIGCSTLRDRNEMKRTPGDWRSSERKSPRREERWLPRCLCQRFSWDFLFGENLETKTSLEISSEFSKIFAMMIFCLPRWLVTDHRKIFGKTHIVKTE